MVSKPAQTIADRVTLSRRYVRSTDVARDLTDPSALDGYVVTASTRSALERLVAALSPASTQRAFRLTGPYGSGKSSFALLLCRLAAGDGRAVEIASAAGVARAAELAPHAVLVMSGRRTSFASDLLSAVEEQARELELADIAATAASARADVDPGLRARLAVDLLDRLARDTMAADGRRTLLLVDEMGRYVEHTAANPRSEDPSVFQQLAERAGGRSGPPLAVIGVLHHRLAEYVAAMGGVVEAEWTRSADRYEEIAFGDSLEQTLHLLAGALDAGSGHTRPVRDAARRLYADASRLGAIGGDPADTTGVADRLFPLHPATIAALTVAARRLGQNERSIFGFLQTLEPSGFQRFIQETPYGPDAWYRLPALFDYLAAQGAIRFGSADRERRWQLALDAVAQLEPGSLEASAMRCVALLATLEPVQSMRATPEALAWCLGIGQDEAALALDALVARGMLYRRPQSGDLSLWSRSSVDLDQWLEEARIRVPANERLDQALVTLMDQRHGIPRRTHHQNATADFDQLGQRRVLTETIVEQVVSRNPLRQLADGRYRRTGISAPSCSRHRPDELGDDTVHPRCTRRLLVEPRHMVTPFGKDAAFVVQQVIVYAVPARVDEHRAVGPDHVEDSVRQGVRPVEKRSDPAHGGVDHDGIACSQSNTG